MINYKNIFSMRFYVDMHNGKFTRMSTNIIYN